MNPPKRKLDFAQLQAVEKFGESNFFELNSFIAEETEKAYLLGFNNGNEYTWFPKSKILIVIDNSIKNYPQKRFFTSYNFAGFKKVLFGKGKSI